MQRTKKSPIQKRLNSAAPETNGSPIEVLTLAEVAAYLRVNEADIIRLVDSQNLPGRLVGGDWRFLKSAIQQWLSIATSTPESRKQAQFALAGKYKDDPDLMRICQEAYRQRGRPIHEGE